MLPRKIKLLIIVGSVLWVLFLSIKFLMSSESSLAGVEHAQRLMDDDSLYRETVNVCLSSDVDRLIGLVATINSIQRNTRHKVKYHILVPRAAYEPLLRWISHTTLGAINYDIRIFDVDKIARMIQVRDGRQDLSKPVAKATANERAFSLWGKMNYARFYYADLFPHLKGRAVHVDDDCIVLGDIFNLNHVSLNKNQTAAFSNDCRTMGKRTAGIDTVYFKYINFTNGHVKSLDLDPMECSFNTGVYAFDVDKWRENNVTAHLEYWLTLNTRENVYGNRVSGGGSQPPMMLVFYRRYAVLNPLWNLRHLGLPSARRYSDRTIASAKLLHWSGPFKPWHGQTTWSTIWDKYYVPDPGQKYKPVRKYGADNIEPTDVEPNRL